MRSTAMREAEHMESGRVLAAERHAPLLSPLSVAAPTTEPSLFQTVAAFFGASGSSNVDCQVCLERVPAAQCVALTACGHMYCEPCMAMFLAVNIREGQVYPKCFHEDTETVDQVQTTVTCGAPIDPADIELLVSDEVCTKYHLFRFNKENECGRQCPFCSHSQRCNGPENPDCQCAQCGETFCFLHANAHPHKSCASYEKDQARLEHETRSVIARISKECPQCKTKIEKEGGCNHMTCRQCSTNFCWMCSAVVDNADLPNHFQWWNLGGCAGLMQAQIRQDTRWQRVVAKVLSLLNFVFIGPASFLLTVVMTIATLGCLPCMCLSDAKFGEIFLLAMELFAWLLLLPVTLSVKLFSYIRQCFRKRDRSVELASSEPQGEADPATIV